MLGWQFALIRLGCRAGNGVDRGDAGAKWVKEAATQPSDLPAVGDTAQGPFIPLAEGALDPVLEYYPGLYSGGPGAGGRRASGCSRMPMAWWGNTLFWVVAMAIAGCLFVIPTAAEIPIVQTMMLAGNGFAPALALLITLPAVSVPSWDYVAYWLFRRKRCG